MIAKYGHCLILIINIPESLYTLAGSSLHGVYVVVWSYTYCMDGLLLTNLIDPNVGLLLINS